MTTITRSEAITKAREVRRCEKPRREAAPRLVRWTVNDYYRMGELGWFRDERVELLNGEVFSKYEGHPWLLNVKQYEKMAKLGWFEGRKVQLVGGKVYEMSPMNNPHWWGVARALRRLNSVFSENFLVVSQLPLTLGEHSQPEPDIAVIAVDADNHPDDKPRTAVLAIEVSDTTLRFDQTKKSLDYAQADILEYWIVNLKARQLEVRTQPTKKGYSSTRTLNENDEVTPLSAPHAKIKVADLLP